jgi:hypothetical protein
MPVREVNRLAEFKNSYPIVIKHWCTQQVLVEAGIRNVKAMDDIPLSLEVNRSTCMQTERERRMISTVSWR